MSKQHSIKAVVLKLGTFKSPSLSGLAVFKEQVEYEKMTAS